MRWGSGGQRRESGFFAANHRRKPASENRRFFRLIRRVNGSLAACRYNQRGSTCRSAAASSTVNRVSVSLILLVPPASAAVSSSRITLRIWSMSQSKGVVGIFVGSVILQEYDYQRNAHIHAGYDLAYTRRHRWRSFSNRH